MKRIIIFGFLPCVLLFSACAPFYIFYDLGNANNGFQDYYKGRENGFCCDLDFGIGAGIGKIHSNDSLNAKLIYRFKIETPSLPMVKLHSFSFTREKDTIPYNLYYQKHLDMSNKVKHMFKIDSLPCSISTKEVEDGGITIIVASSEIYDQVKTLYISYDIEVDGERIIKKNIKYKKRLSIGCSLRSSW